MVYSVIPFVQIRSRASEKTGVRGLSQDLRTEQSEVVESGLSPVVSRSECLISGVCHE
jgi:hypothetical protein